MPGTPMFQISISPEEIAALELASFPGEIVVIDEDGEALDQAVRYHSALKPSYLLLTNGTGMYCFKTEGQGLRSMDHLPGFSEMQNA